MRHFVSPARLDPAEDFEQFWRLNLNYRTGSKRREDIRFEPADCVGAMPFAPSAAHLVDEFERYCSKRVLRLQDLPALGGLAFAGRIAAVEDRKPRFVALSPRRFERDFWISAKGEQFFLSAERIF